MRGKKKSHGKPHLWSNAPAHPRGDMRPEKGSHQPKLPIRSGRGENPASHCQPWWGSRDCVEVPQPFGGLSSTCWKPSSPQSLKLPPHLPAVWGHWLLTEAPCAPRARGQPLPAPCPFPRLRRGSSELTASSTPLPPPPVLQVREQGPERTSALHRVTQLLVSESSPKL